MEGIEMRICRCGFFQGSQADYCMGCGAKIDKSEIPPPPEEVAVAWATELQALGGPCSPAHHAIVARRGSEHGLELTYCPLCGGRLEDDLGS